jgi:3-oxoadipate enol-lactonase
LIIDDLIALLEHVSPPRPVLVGLSIGGLFAAKAILKGSQSEGLVLINTLRKPGLALDWVNEAIIRAAALGGSQLVMDMFLPMLVGPAKLPELHNNCLGDEGYEPADPKSGLMRLLENSRSVDWDLPYEKLYLPVLIMTGLRDRVFYSAGEISELLARLPDAKEMLYPELGHLIPAEDSAVVVEALTLFAAKIQNQA